MPARFRDIVRVLGEYGVRIEEPRTGSHWKAISKSGLSFRITAHNGLKSEIPDVYIRGICRTFEIDLAEFKKKL